MHEMKILVANERLPKIVNKVKAPPIKCQGIKTKLVPFIFSSIKWNGKGRWVEPFLGSGVVLFNLLPKRAFIADSNVHLIQFYKDIQNKIITPEKVRSHLEFEGQLLLKKGEEHYYDIRERFNKEPNSYDFIFLSRSCFNGVMRFNKKGKYNVPFCRKPDRFRPAYVTKIVNQVQWVSQIIYSSDWTFEVADWRDTLSQTRENDFVYADPPYAGRHTDYYNSWNDDDATELFENLLSLPCGFALSTWKQNQYRENFHLINLTDAVKVRIFEHFYHVGAKEDNRAYMEEALVLKNEYSA